MKYRHCENSGFVEEKSCAAIVKHQYFTCISITQLNISKDVMEHPTFPTKQHSKNVDPKLMTYLNVIIMISFNTSHWEYSFMDRSSRPSQEPPRAAIPSAR